MCGLTEARSKLPAQTVQNAPASRERSGAGHPEVSRMPEEAYKRCSRCKVDLPASEFNRHSTNKDGLQTTCRRCQLLRNREWREKNPEAATELRRRYRARHLDEVRERRRNEKIAHPEHHRARRAVQQAVREGRIVKPSACTECGIETPDLQGHHEDYSRRYDVMWLCSSCHGAKHRRVGA